VYEQDYCEEFTNRAMKCVLAAEMVIQAARNSPTLDAFPDDFANRMGDLFDTIPAYGEGFWRRGVETVGGVAQGIIDIVWTYYNLEQSILCWVAFAKGLASDRADDAEVAADVLKSLVGLRDEPPSTVGGASAPSWHLLGARLAEHVFFESSLASHREPDVGKAIHLAVYSGYNTGFDSLGTLSDYLTDFDTFAGRVLDDFRSLALGIICHWSGVVETLRDCEFDREWLCAQIEDEGVRCQRALGERGGREREPNRPPAAWKPTPETRRIIKALADGTDYDTAAERFHKGSETIRQIASRARKAGLLADNGGKRDTA
jgi:hypothetical protein